MILLDTNALVWLAHGQTRDPFDRLLVAHARLRDWKLATADTGILDQLDASQVVAL